MLKGMDVCKTLKIATFAFDLEGGMTGAYNLGKYYTESLNQASTSAALFFGSQVLFLPFAIRKPIGQLAKDEYWVNNGIERLKKTLRSRDKEYCIEAPLKVLTVGIDQVPDPDDVGYIIARNYLEELENDRIKCKKK